MAASRRTDPSTNVSAVVPDMGPARVSVVTISFNQAPYLRAAMDSVLAQEGVELEYIVVDPGSSDGSREIIRGYGDRVRAVFEPDCGPADGLNRGLSYATGEFFYYLNADDIVAPGALAAATGIMREHPHLDLVYGCGAIIDSDGRRVKDICPPKISAPKYAFRAAFILQQAAVIRTSTLRTAGGFNPENRTCWDGEAFLDILLAGGRCRRVMKELGYFRLYAQSISGSGRLNARYLEDQKRMFMKATGRHWIPYLDDGIRQFWRAAGWVTDFPRLRFAAKRVRR